MVFLQKNLPHERLYNRCVINVLFERMCFVVRPSEIKKLMCNYTGRNSNKAQMYSIVMNCAKWGLTAMVAPCCLKLRAHRRLITSLWSTRTTSIGSEECIVRRLTTRLSESGWISHWIPVASESCCRETFIVFEFLRSRVRMTMFFDLLKVPGISLKNGIFWRSGDKKNYQMN